VYDDDDAGLKLNNVAEFVGILTFDPQLSMLGGGSGGDLTSALQVEGQGGDGMEEELPPGLRLSPSKVRSATELFVPPAICIGGIVGVKT
jgi:hypothetical protein